MTAAEITAAIRSPCRTWQDFERIKAALRRVQGAKQIAAVRAARRKR